MYSRNSCCLLALLLAVLKQDVNAKAGVVDLVTTWITIVEDKGPVNVALTRTGGSDGYLTVNYETHPVTASAEVDFAPTVGSVTFANGQTEAFVEVPIRNDGVEETTEQFFFLLSGPNAGHRTLLAIQIVDDDMYSQWSQWSGQCSKTCGKGTTRQIRTRTCQAEQKSQCLLRERQSRETKCNLGSCERSTSGKCWGRWGDWIPDGTCSLLCKQKWTRGRWCYCERCTGRQRKQTRKTSCQRSWCLLSKSKASKRDDD